MIKVIVTAARGAQDRLIIQEILSNTKYNRKMKLVGATAPKGSTYVGEDVALVAGYHTPCGAFVHSNIEEIIELCDIVIDFSTREHSMEVLDVCIKYQKPLIIGTTSFDDNEVSQIIAGAKKIPLLKAANTSRMVNVMMSTLEQLALDLKDSCKIEIIDMHDENKKDAPSGTAKEMAKAVCESSGKQKEEVNHHSVRLGDISSTHKVIFGGFGERIEISHEAYSFRCFAAGACDAILFLIDKQPRLYEIGEVFK